MSIEGGAKIGRKEDLEDAREDLRAAVEQQDNAEAVLRDVACRYARGEISWSQLKVAVDNYEDVSRDVAVLIGHVIVCEAAAEEA